MKTTDRSLNSRVLAVLRIAAMLGLPVLVLATIEKPARASATISADMSTPVGLLPTGVGLAVLLALRRQKKRV